MHLVPTTTIAKTIKTSLIIRLLFGAGIVMISVFRIHASLPQNSIDFGKPNNHGNRKLHGQSVSHRQGGVAVTYLQIDVYDAFVQVDPEGISAGPESRFRI